MLVSPTEPAMLREGGEISPFPELHGVDYVIIVPGHMIGVQRKEIKDFVASVKDGRLAKEKGQWSGSPFSRIYLLMEGRVRVNNKGEILLGKNSYGFKLSQMRGVLLGLGVEVIWSDGLEDTKEYLTHLEEWWSKESHGLSRPGPRVEWGKAGNRDFQIHLLMGLPGIGRVLAERILDEVGMPFGWKVGMEELMEVDGLGEKKVKEIWKCLE